MSPRPPLSADRTRRLAYAVGAACAAGVAVRRAMNRTATSHSRALERERALRRAGAALVAAPDRDAVLAAGLAAIPELAGPGARGAITVARGHRIVVKGDAGPHPLRIPLRGRDPQGVLSVDAPGGVDADTRAALEEFAAELGTALESTRLAAQLARRDADAWYRSLIDNAADAITVLERDGTIRYQTPSIQDILGFPPAALAGTNLAEAIHPDDREWVQAQFDRIRRRPGAADSSVVMRWRHRDGSYRSVESRAANLLGDPAVKGIVVNSRDVTDRVTLEEQLTRRAFHDTLTGLANRALFVDRLEHALYAGNPQEERLAVLFIDLDDFRNVNDSLGHPAGDELLRICARRLTERLAAGDTAARLGGDEFAILLESCGSRAAAWSSRRRRASRS
jgi:PAS domain S-box-containing protein